MQKSGEFVLLDADNRVQWTSDTNSNLDGYLVMQNDGNLVIYASTPVEKPVWATNTSGRSCPGTKKYD